MAFDAIRLTGWNLWAQRFVQPPVWTWEPVHGAASYDVLVASAQPPIQPAVRHRSLETRFDMASLWPTLPFGPCDMLILAHDAHGQEVCASLHKSFFKIPGYDRRPQEPLDWGAAVERNMVYLLAPARDDVADYERGLPRGLWSGTEDSPSGRRLRDDVGAFPGLHHPIHIRAFLRFAQGHPHHHLAAEARRQARQYGDWLLHHNVPQGWACAGMPFSWVRRGQLEDRQWGSTIVRAGRVGAAMIVLYQDSGDEAFLSYARTLADLLLRFQNADGSWPFRVNGQDGSALDAYTSNAVSPAVLFSMLESIAPDARYAAARHKAVEWILAGPVKTRRWQGMYEDIGKQQPYRNLENWDTNETIRYLVHFRDSIPGAVAVAEELNAWIEDQFVVWQAEDFASMGTVDIDNYNIPPFRLYVPTPSVLEQYVVPFPMEQHGANWILSLLALHQATRGQHYLDKAVAAANAIVRSQQPNGAFSTFGFDLRFGRPLSALNWLPCNAGASGALLTCDGYCRAQQAGHDYQLDLWGL